MRILQLTKKVPYPIKDGEVIGIINLTIGFAGHGHFVHVLSLNTNKHYFNLAKLPASIAALGKFEAVGNALMVECGKGTLCIDRLKPAGKSEMTAMAFLAGYKNLINQ